MKLTVRIKGGLGNQLFCYAAARRLALKNNAELVIDNITGFVRDQTYQRQYALDHFSIPARLATSAERLEPFERYRRGFVKWRSRRLPFEQRAYLEQELKDFDPRLLDLQINNDLYLDGLWQSEAYFEDIAEVLQRDLLIKPLTDPANLNMAARIGEYPNAVALHVRWFDAPIAIVSNHNISGDYYQRAVAHLKSIVDQPHYFVFSDYPIAAVERLALPDDCYTIVDHNNGDEYAYADLWLMTQCRHFITANSTFSWWGAWLGASKGGGVVITPDPATLEPDNYWCTKNLLPKGWSKF